MRSSALLPLLLPLLSLFVEPSAGQYTTSASFLANNPMTNGGLLVSNFDPRPASDTPGNVGLCFSGGGSRALSATMGQLRALNQMGVLSQAKALSSVSGGSWATVPFTFLPSSVSDDEFLGPYVANPGDLHVTGIFGGSTASQLDTLASQNLGAAIANNHLTLLDIAMQGVALYNQGVALHDIWNHIIGENILGTFGLSSFGSNNLPDKFFCSTETVCNEILSANSAQYSGFFPISTNSIRRPFHIINTAMFVDVPSLNAPSGFQYLVPFHATPYYAGVPSTPPGAQSISTGNQVGGGTVQSFAFNSLLQSSSSGNSVSVQQNAPFALSDITGSSSSFFAEYVANTISQNSLLSGLVSLDPKFNYWSSADVSNGASGGMERFSDAGTLDNTGVCAMLQYQDIENLIVFINTESPMTQTDGGISVDSMVAALFGFQPFASGTYTPFPSPSASMSSTAASTEFRFNQVFDSSQFNALLQGLVQASTNNGASSLNTAPAVFLQQGLTVQANAWWGIPGGQTVNVLWVYNQAASQFNSQLQSSVEILMQGINFPWYNTAFTGLDAFHVNLLAHFSCWVLMQNEASVMSLFSSGDGSLLATEGEGGVAGRSSLVNAAVALTALVSLTIALIAGFAKIRRTRRSQNVEMDSLIESNA